MHLNSELLFTKYAIPYFKHNFRILEIGPAGFPSAFQRVVNNSNIQWHTIDFHDSTFISSAINNLTYHLNSPYRFPVDDETYDIILSGQVIEHVEKIWTWMKELKRITKKGGRIITINPVSWPYHEAPVDCWRIFPAGIAALAEEFNLEVELCKFESIERSQLMQLDSKIKTIPGRSYSYPPSKLSTLKKIITLNKLIRKLPFLNDQIQIPIEVAYDTISILKK
jgi:SAM-dependent methyltransferase